MDTPNTPNPTPKKAAQIGYHVALIAGVVAALANPGTEISLPPNPDIERRLDALEAKAASPRVSDQISSLRQEVASLRATIDLLIRFDGRITTPLRAPVVRKEDK